MDRQVHNYAAAMAFAQQQQQQQQQFGFHPQPQHFSQQQLHSPPFLPHHPSLQQFPFPRPLPQQQQLLPHHLPHHHPLHLQQQQQQPPPSFPPQFPPHPMSSPFLNPYDSPAPPPTAPPSDPELHKRIDKLVEYSAKNGPEFEAMIREKQQDNPDYSFLFGAEGHGYYRYKLWLSTRAAPASSQFNPALPPSSMAMMPPALNPLLHPPPNASPSMLGAPQMQQPSFGPFYDQQQPHQPFLGHARPEYDSPAKPFKGLSGPLPSDVAAELSSVLNNLSGTKESIKGAKIWFMQRSPFAPALAEALRDRVLTLDDSERQLHIIYLANDILFDSLQRRINPRELDNEALAFKPVLGTMLARIYHNAHNKDANQSRLQKILQFWASKEVYDPDTIYNLEGEMIAGPPSLSGLPKESSAATADLAGLQTQTPQNLNQWQLDKQRSTSVSSLDQDSQEKQVPSATLSTSQFAPPISQQFLSNQLPAGMYPPVATASYGSSGPAPMQSATQTPIPHLNQTSTVNIGEQPPPYPLFPPGLIPGMVRKMQIGSGVPYSPMSPLDIPTVIPPSTVPPSEILERVSKFFKEIGEVNPSEGMMKPADSNDEEDEYERESLVRKGGACIPPPPNLQQVDPETGTLPDGSFERKPGSSSSGRLGLGASANPNEVSQYDDVYTSYRKQRSTSYHSSMSARAAAR